MNPDYRKRLSLNVLLAFTFITVVGSISYSRFIRLSLLPKELGYIPKEANIILATGDIESLWKAVEHHFGRVIREKDRKGMLASAMHDAREEFEKKKKPVLSVAQLHEYGLDVTRGILLGISLSLDSGSGVAVIPLSDRRAFTEFMETMSKTTARPARERCGDQDGWVDEAIDIDGAIIAFPEPDTAVISDSCELIAHSIQDQQVSLAHIRANDRLFDAVRYRLGRPLLLGAGILLYMSQLPLLPLPPRANFAVAITFETQNVRVEADLELG